MKGQELIINFENGKAFLGSTKILNLGQLNLPDFFKPVKQPSALKIEVVNYNIEEKSVFARILSYNTGKISYPLYQVSEESEINKIEKIIFKSVDTNGVYFMLKSNGTFHEFIPSIEKIPERRETNYIHIPSSNPIKREPLVNIIRETFSIYFKNTHFKPGSVSFEKRIAQLDKTVEFSIDNDFIREEFDAIKNYFANILGTKKIQVDVVIQLTDGEIKILETKSPEISKINQNLIESVKFEYVKGLTKNKIENGKFVFTIDEFFETFSDQRVKANVFYSNENQFIEDLLKITNTKHYNHLRFLSSKHEHSIMKLRFVFKPFSFIFLITGEKNYHIILETLDTKEATYIWHEEKDKVKLKDSIKKIENAINTFKSIGKTDYINNSEDNFKRIYHDYSDINNGFSKWKSEVESVLA